MPGPAKKPRHMKLIAGTTRKDRETSAEKAAAPADSGEIQAITGIPQPPDWLPNAHALKEWNRLVPLLMQNNRLSEIGLSPLAMACALHGRIVQKFTAGETPTGHMMAQYINLLKLLGISDNGGVGPAGAAQPKENAFKRNARRRSP